MQTIRIIARKSRAPVAPPKISCILRLHAVNCSIEGAYGGRVALSFSFAKMAAIWGFVEPLIPCTRDIQDSIKESFHAELKNAIASGALAGSGLAMLALTTYAKERHRVHFC